MVYDYNRNKREFERYTQIKSMWKKLYKIICVIQKELERKNPNFNRIEYLDLEFEGNVKKIHNYQKLSVYSVYLHVFSNLDNNINHKIACLRHRK